MITRGAAAETVASAAKRDVAAKQQRLLEGRVEATPEPKRQRGVKAKPALGAAKRATAAKPSVAAAVKKPAKTPAVAATPAKATPAKATPAKATPAPPGVSTKLYTQLAQKIPAIVHAAYATRNASTMEGAVAGGAQQGEELEDSVEPQLGARAAPRPARYLT
jgi:hypothetical protein